MENIIYNATSNISFNASKVHILKPLTIEDYRYKCEIDQLDMLMQLEKYPTAIYSILFIGFIVFTLYIFLIHHKYPHLHDTLIIPYMFMLCATFLYLFQTYPVSSEVFNKYDWILYVIAGILATYNGWKYRKIIKGAIWGS